MTLVGWWKLDGDATDSIGTNDGTPTDISWIDGKIGQCASFNGSSSWIDYNDLLGNLIIGSLSLWFKKDNTNTQYLMDGRSISSWWLLTHYNGYDINFENRVTWNGLNLDEWYHVVVTCSPSETQMYVNGDLVDTGSGIAFDLRDLRFGTRYTNSSYLSGEMDDVKIYNHILSTKEIKELSRAKVAHWKMDEKTILHYGFESGSFGGEWTVNNAYIKTDYMHSGNYSMGSDNQGTIDAILQPSTLSGGKEINSFEYYWWEDGSQTGHNVDLLDSSGNLVLRSGTENPQWYVTDNAGKVEIYGGDNYNEWIYYKFIFNWGDGTYDYYMEDTASGTTRSGNRTLNNSTNVEKIQFAGSPYGSGNYNRFDDIRIGLNIVHDSSGYENHGYNDGATFTTNSKIGSGCYDFDTTGEITVPNNDILNPSSITVAFWINLNSTPDGHAGIVDNEHSSAYAFYTDKGEKECNWYVVNSNGDSNSLRDIDTPVGEWHHIVGTYDENTGDHYVYKNGSQVRSGSISAYPLGSSSQDILIGNATGYSNLDATLDDVRIYSTALTQTEIEELYKERASLDENGNFSTHHIIETAHKPLILDYTQWQDGGTGSVGEFSQNGSTSENERVIYPDPWGKETVVWKCIPDSTSGPDGGWNAGFTNDNSNRLRMSVFVKRIDSMDGRTYLGCDNSGNTLNLDGTSNGNPYFWYGNLPELNQWYLLVGILHPNSYTGSDTGESGVYDLRGNQVRSGTDFKWGTDSNQEQRAYLYYSTTTSERQYFVYPRVDVVDGTEPSLTDLLEGHDSKKIDYVRTKGGTNNISLDVAPDVSRFGVISETGPMNGIVGWWNEPNQKASDWENTYNNNLSVDGNGQTITIETATAQKSGWYKVSYGCAWNSETANDRHIMANWIEKNGSQVTPSETRCYIRTDSVGDWDSNSATLLVNVSSGDTITLKGTKDHGEAGTTVTVSDCWLYLFEETNSAMQVYDSSGGQDYDGGAITVNLDTTTKNDNLFNHSGDYIEVLEGGRYKFYYTVNCHDTGQGNRQSVRSWLRKNGSTDIYPSESYSYIRNNGNGDQNHQTGVGIVNLNKGDYLEIRNEKVYQESGGTSVVMQNMNWLLLEKSGDIEASYSNGGSTQRINLDSTDVVSSQLTVNRNGLYEVSYVFGYSDGGTNGRHITHTWLRKNGSTDITPSEQMSYTRGDYQGQLNANSVNIVTPLQEGDYIELLSRPETGGYIDTLENSTYVTVTYLEPGIKDLVDGNHGVNYGATITTGVEGLAYEFDGSDDYISVDDTVISSGLENLTASAWIYITGNANNSWERYIDLQDGSGNDDAVLYWDDDDAIYGFHGLGGNARITGSDPPQGEWMHWVGVCDGTDAKFYVNTQHQATDSTTHTSSNSVLSIGKRYDANDQVKAKIQDVRIYNRALSQEEIQILYELTGGSSTRKMMQTENKLYTKSKFKEV